MILEKNEEGLLIIKDDGSVIQFDKNEGQKLCSKFKELILKELLIEDLRSERSTVCSQIVTNSMILDNESVIQKLVDAMLGVDESDSILSHAKEKLINDFNELFPFTLDLECTDLKTNSAYREHLCGPSIESLKNQKIINGMITKLCERNQITGEICGELWISERIQVDGQDVEELADHDEIFLRIDQNGNITYEI